MDVTSRWTLPLLFAGQAQKEMFHNEALTIIDVLLHASVASADLASPPAEPALGDCWIVAGGGTGGWAGKDGMLTCWSEGGWRFLQPARGLTVEVVDRGHAMTFDGTQWRDGAIRADGLYLADERVITTRRPGIAAPIGGTVIDAEARTAIATILQTLRVHGLIEP